MAKNRGTADGDIQEKEIVANFNTNKFSNLFRDYVLNFPNYRIDEIYMIRVTTEQFSRLCNQQVKTRSDAYLIHSNDKFLASLLQKHNNYLDEGIIKNSGILYSPIIYSGLSIKLSDASKYQILKLTPISFKTLFGVSELGAGASLYCLEEYELCKNSDLIRGWHSTEERMVSYFSEIIKEAPHFYLNKVLCKRVKNYSEKEIANIIDSSKDLQQKIFNGITLYNEPYTAYYIYHNNSIKKLEYIPYSVTTGSGRSKGKYTIVLKPR